MIIKVIAAKPFSHRIYALQMVSIPSFISDNGSMTISTPERYGPWGGISGTIFDDGIYTGVRQINLTRGLGISSIKVLYDRNGQAIWGDKRGVSGGDRPEKVIQFQYQCYFDCQYSIVLNNSIGGKLRT
jgi:hypothetical protein